MFHRVSLNGHVDLARILVEHGADAAAQYKEEGLALLHRASVGGTPCGAEQCVDVTAQDKHGSTPLHRASIRGHMNLTRFLVEHGADATAKNILQITSSDPGSCIYP